MYSWPKTVFLPMVGFFGRPGISINLKVAYFSAENNIQLYIFAISRIDYLSIHPSITNFLALVQRLQWRNVLLRIVAAHHRMHRSRSILRQKQSSSQLSCGIHSRNRDRPAPIGGLHQETVRCYYFVNVFFLKQCIQNFTIQLPWYGPIDNLLHRFWLRNVIKMHHMF